MATIKQVTYRVSGETLTATLPTGVKVELSTDLTFDELMSVGTVAVLLDADEVDEAQLFSMLANGTLVPAGVREKIGGISARYALPVFVRWLQESVKVLSALSLNAGEPQASS